MDSFTAQDWSRKKKAGHFPCQRLHILKWAYAMNNCYANSSEQKSVFRLDTKKSLLRYAIPAWDIRIIECIPQALQKMNFPNSLMLLSCAKIEFRSRILSFEMISNCCLCKNSMWRTWLSLSVRADPNSSNTFSCIVYYSLMCRCRSHSAKIYLRLHK